VGGSSGSPARRLYPSGGIQSLRGWKGAYPPMSSCWISCAVWNCWRTPWPISHFAIICRPLLIESIWVILYVPALANSWSLFMWWLQKSSTWRTDCVGHPQVQCGVVFRTWMLASYTFSPRTSVRSRKLPLL
jgi:hypothetical protein